MPATFTAVSYKGDGTVLDLRAAELTSKGLVEVRSTPRGMASQLLSP